MLNSNRNENNVDCIAIIPISEQEENINNVEYTTNNPSNKRSILEKRLIKLASISCFVAGVLLIALVAESYYYFGHKEEITVCNTSECFRSAAMLMQSMNRSVDPCDNFYNYVCGNWKRDHPIIDNHSVRNFFTEADEYLVRKIQEILQQGTSDDEPLPVTQAKILYQGCMDTRITPPLGLTSQCPENRRLSMGANGLLTEHTYTKDMEEIPDDTLDYMRLDPLYILLDDVHLPLRPELSINETGNKATHPEFDWVRTVVKTQRKTSIELLIAFDVRPALKNNSVYRISIRKPGDTTLLPDPEATTTAAKEEKDHQQRNSRLKLYIYNVMLKIYNGELIENFMNSKIIDEATVGNFTDLIWEAAEQIMILSLKLEKIEKDNVEKYEDEVIMPIWELEKLTEVNGKAQVNWIQYFKYMYEGIKFVPLNLNRDYEIVVRSKKYFQSLAEILSETPKEVLEMTLWWKVVELLLPYTDKTMREVSVHYTYDHSSRSIFCTKVVKSVMKMALSYIVADDNFFKVTQKKVEDMVRNIRGAFSSMVESVKWMDTNTKTATLMKLQDINVSIGFPGWILDRDVLEDYYEGVEVNRSSFLLDVLETIEVSVTDELTMLGKEFEHQGVISDPFDVNAYYTVQENDVVITFGILQFPFYGLGLESLNYGNLGSTIGHELTHGFDSKGWKFDKNGNLRPWWSVYSVVEFAKRSYCFIQQFNNYKLDGIAVNGLHTLSENLADDGGLRAALLAYQKLVNEIGIEPKLPGFEEFTHEQLFFLSYVNSWCENWTPKYLQSTVNDTHAPNYIRSIASVTNSEDFSRIWNCPKGSPMNPNRKKCRIW